MLTEKGSGRRQRSHCRCEIPGKAAESRNLASYLSCTQQDFLTVCLPPEVKQHSSMQKCPTHTLDSLARPPPRVIVRGEKTERKKWRKVKENPRAKRGWWAGVLLGIPRPPHAALIYMKIYSVCRRDPGCCRCDWNQTGTWRCKFLLHLISHSLSKLWLFSADYAFYNPCYNSYHPAPPFFCHSVYLQLKNSRMICPFCFFIGTLSFVYR